MSVTFLEWIFKAKSSLLVVLSYVIGAVFLLLGGSMAYSLKMTWRKYKLITRRSTMERWDQSYCLFSKLLAQIILIGTPFCFALVIC